MRRVLLPVLLMACHAEAAPVQQQAQAIEDTSLSAVVAPRVHHVDREIAIHDYFEYMDSLVAAFDPDVPYPLTEHLLARANPWLIERLAETDYYRMMDRGEFAADPQALPALQVGDTLIIPEPDRADSLATAMEATLIDVNIPEFRLRILQDGVELFRFPVRVGQNRRRYLEMAGREVDLRTLPGQGTIVRIERDAVFRNPVDNHRYELTRRDDGRTTGLPRIPWLEPELDGKRHGQLIHPTTNIETLGNAYSNGCVGASEYAVWWIYYHAPLGTRVVYRYDLDVIGAQGQPIRLEDIYGWSRRVAPAREMGGCL